jgi:hypothetical protein
MHRAPPQPLGWIGILEQGIGDYEHRESGVPQGVEPHPALEPGAKQPPGANTLGKVSTHGMTTNAVKRYPLAITSSARDRKMPVGIVERHATKRTSGILVGMKPDTRTQLMPYVRPSAVLRAMPPSGCAAASGTGATANIGAPHRLQSSVVLWFSFLRAFWRSLAALGFKHNSRRIPTIREYGVNRIAGSEGQRLSPI